MLLANTLPDPNHFASIGWVLVILAAIIVGLRQGIGFFRDLKQKPEPYEVQREAAAAYVTKPVFESHIAVNHREHENLFSKIGGMERGIRGELKTDFEKLSEALSDLSREVGGLKDVGEVRSQQMARLESKMDRLAERITT